MKHTQVVKEIDSVVAEGSLRVVEQWHDLIRDEGRIWDGDRISQEVRSCISQETS